MSYANGNPPIGPYRVRRERKKGWVSPPNTVCVARPSRFGNPYVIGSWVTITGFMSAGGIVVNTYESSVQLTRDMALALFRRDLTDDPSFAADARRELRGKNLSCYCSLDEPCHADILLTLVNA